MLKVSHYGASMKPVELLQQAEQICKLMAIKLKENQVVVLFYSGMSGVASATALALTMQRFNMKLGGMVYIRKQNEVSHGSDIETSLMNVKKTDDLVPIFVDDFVCNGTTFKYVLTRVVNRISYRGMFFNKTSRNVLNIFDKLLINKDNWWIAQLNTKELKKANKVQME